MPMSPRLLRPIASRSLVDADATAYLTAVQTADGQALEPAVRDAITAFVIGCKSDGIWSAIKASCILMGARTVAGALVPLAGPTPTNVNFASADYLRGGSTPGFRGNASNKAINANYAANADPQDDCHAMAWNTQTPATASLSIMFSAAWSSPNGRFMFWNGGNNGIANGSSGDTGVYCNGGSQLQTQRFTGAWGVSRSNSSSFSYMTGGSVLTQTAASVAPTTNNLQVFRAQITTSAFVWGDPRICFYSFGRSVNIASLRDRVSTLVSAIGAAIP